MTSRDEPHASSSKGWLQDIYVKHMKRKKSLRRRVLTVQLSMRYSLSGGKRREIQMDRRRSSAIRPKFCQHMGNMISGELWGHLGITVGETVVGFLLGTLVGTRSPYSSGGHRFLTRFWIPIWLCSTVCRK